MITTPLLEIKYKAQKQLDEEAQHDIGRYVENSSRIVREIEAKFGLKFKYTQRLGGEIDPPGSQSKSA